MKNRLTKFNKIKLNSDLVLRWVILFLFTYAKIEECQTFRTMDDSYHGLFVPSLDFSYRCENFSFLHIFTQSIEGGD